MDGMTEAHRYDALGHQLPKRRHGKFERLTVSPRKAFMTSRRALRGQVDDGGELERENIMGECDSM